MLSVQARLQPDRIGARDLEREMSFRDWNERSCRLANALLGLGLAKGDRVAVLAYNCVEWLEIYAATAKAGLDRRADQLPAHQPPRSRYVVENAEAAASSSRTSCCGVVEEVRADLPVRRATCIHFGRRRAARPATATTRT